MNVLVTGASRGLGYSLCKEFAERGACVYAGVRVPPKAEKLMKLAEKYPDKVFPFRLDVTSEEDAQAAAGMLEEKDVQLDALIQNAGIFVESERNQTLLEGDIASLRALLDVNTVGCAIVAKYFLPRLKKGAVMMFITSEGCSPRFAGSVYAGYGISKCAATRLALSVRAALGKEYHVFAVHPGRMDTDMGHLTAQIQPEEAAQGIADLLYEGIQNEYDGYIDYLGRPMEL